MCIYIYILEREKSCAYIMIYYIFYIFHIFEAYVKGILFHMLYPCRFILHLLKLKPKSWIEDKQRGKVRESLFWKAQRWTYTKFRDRKNVHHFQGKRQCLSRYPSTGKIENHVNHMILQTHGCPAMKKYQFLTNLHDAENDFWRAMLRNPTFIWDNDAVFVRNHNPHLHHYPISILHYP